MARQKSTKPRAKAEPIGPVSIDGETEDEFIKRMTKCVGDYFACSDRPRKGMTVPVRDVVRLLSLVNQEKPR